MASLALALTGTLSVAADPAPPQATAAPTGGSGAYYVEVLVFRASNPSTGGEDLSHLSATNVAPEVSADADTQRAAAGTGSVRLLQKLPANNYRLNDVKARLDSSGAYRTVAHSAWTQTAANWGSHIGLSAEQLGLTEAGVTGIIYLERGQYLHLGMNLAWGSSSGTYAMSEMRRVRFNERNYYDHPAFGVIAVVSPVGGNAR